MPDSPFPASPDPRLERYSRQMLFAEIGEAGQRRLLASRVTLIGCGALGSMLADRLVRAGVGSLRIVDRDYVELNNLQRQILFDEEDVADNLPKAEAARRKLVRINSAVEVEAIVADANHHTIERFCHGADVLLDGTDNFETRFLINDVAVKHKQPWVYGACVGAAGLALPILPGETPCLQCVFEHAPPPELTPTCDVAGVLGPVVTMVASHQATETLKILLGRTDALNRRLLHFDAWAGHIALLHVEKAFKPGRCPCCGQGRFDYLSGQRAHGAATLCGRDAVQVAGPPGTTLDFEAVAEKLRGVAEAPPMFNAFLLRVRVEGREMTIFPDGRAIIKGTTKPEEARSLYARYIGS